nr:hypothetical protein [uncultured Acetatifactor sp.]
MHYIIALIVIIIVIGLLLDFLKSVLKFMLKAIAVIATIALTIFLIVTFAPISLYVIGAVVCIAIACVIITKTVKKIKKYNARKKEIATIRQWMSGRPKLLSENYLEDMICTEINKAKEQFRFDEWYSVNEMPYGRANAILNLFQRNIQGESPLFLGIYLIGDYRELQEYGCLYTDRGIYIVYKINGELEKEFIDYKCLYQAEYIPGSVKFIYTLIDFETNSFKQKTVDLSWTNVYEAEGACIYNICRKIIDFGVNKSLYRNSIVNESQYRSLVDSIQRDKFAYWDISQLFDLGETAGMIYTLGKALDFNKKELKGYMHGNQGHGVAAEYGNNTIDRFLGRQMVNAASNLDSSGRQVKNGADRIVNGVPIQTKYYNDNYNDKPRTSSFIGAVVTDGHLRYMQNGVPMKLEVPRDKYESFVDAFQKKIDKGEIAEIAPGSNARDYIRKGYLTYDQSYAIKHALTIQGVAIDTLNGFNLGKDTAVANFIVHFAIETWNGKNVEDAFQASLQAGGKNLGHSVLVNVLVQQFSREKVANLFVRNFISGEKAGFVGIDNPVYKLSDFVADKVSQSNLAKSEIGKCLGLDKVDVYQVINTTAVVCITYGPDIVKAIEGRISGKQLFKNSAVATASLGAGKFAVAVAKNVFGVAGGVPGAIVSILGGMFGGYAAKRILDNYIQDDSVRMFIVLKKEFLDVTMQVNLSQEELLLIADNTIGAENVPDILEEMYMSGEEKQFARELIVGITTSVIAQRKKVTYDQMVRGAAITFCQYIREFCIKCGLEESKISNIVSGIEKIVKIMDSGNFDMQNA